MKFVVVLLALVFFSPLVFAALLSPNEPAVANYDSTTLNGSYDELIAGLYKNGNVSLTMGSYQIVPWFDSSSSCSYTNLKNGSSCDIGNIVNFNTAYCMVSDEQSQVMLIDSMGTNQTRFDNHVRTLRAINSSYGIIPSWKVLVNASAGTLTACDSRTNSNCDTASDATARFILALRTATNNTLFTNTTAKADYYLLAKNLTQDMLTHEVVNECYNSSLGYGPICYWLAGGSVVASFGLDTSAFAYTGYFPDAAMAFLQACVQDGNLTYCQVAGNITLNYLQAAKFDGQNFTVPPGLSFKWTNLTGIPNASCSNTCGPVQWDSVDAPRAHALGMLLYYATVTNTTGYFPGLSAYMVAWNGVSLGNVQDSLPVQFYPNGTASAANLTSYRGQGWQAQGLFNLTITDLNESLRSALGHYGTATDTWDSSACFGVYSPAFPVRALGEAIGRGLESWNVVTQSGGGGDTPGLNFTSTLNAPTNESTLTQNYTTLNVTVSTTNFTSTCVGNTTTSIRYTTTFASDAAGWTGGTYNSTDDTYMATADWAVIVSPDLNLSDYSWIEFTFMGYFTLNYTTNKIFFYETASSTDNDHLLGDNSAATLRWRPEPGYSPSYTTSYDAWHNYTVRINQSGAIKNMTLAVDGTDRWTRSGVTMNNASGRDYARFVMGDLLDGGYFKMTNITLTATGTATTCTPDDQVLNVTFLWTNGTVAGTSLNNANNTAATLDLTNLSDATYTWGVNVTNGQQSQVFTGYTFTIDTPEPPAPPTPAATSSCDTIVGNILGGFSDFTGQLAVIGTMLGILAIFAVIGLYFGGIVEAEAVPQTLFWGGGLVGLLIVIAVVSSALGGIC